MLHQDDRETASTRFEEMDDNNQDKMRCIAYTGVA